MTTPPTTDARTLTIDRRRHVALVRDQVLMVVGSATGRGGMALWALIGFAVGFAALGGSWLVGLGLAVVGAAARVTVWWVKTEKEAREGLAVGQTITVSRADSGNLSIVDVTGEHRFPRGAAWVVRRRSLVVVVTASLSFVLPGELLTEDEVAFLEDRAGTASAYGPLLPLVAEVTPALQAALVARATRLVVLSADFLLPYLVLGFFLVVTLAVRSWGLAAVTAVLALVTCVPGPVALRRMRTGLRTTYAVGGFVRAAVMDEHLLVSFPRGTRFYRWADHLGHRVTADAVLLRQRRRPLTATKTEVLPKELFTEAALGELARALPRRF